MNANSDPAIVPVTAPANVKDEGCAASPSCRGVPTICYPLSGDSLGGSHVSLRGLLDQLNRQDARLLVVPEGGGGTLANFFSDYEQEQDPAAPENGFAPGRPFGLIKFLKALCGVTRRVRFLREQGVDIVHSNDGRTHATWALPAKLAGAKLVWHHRGDPGAKGLRYLAPLLADQIVTVSRFALPLGTLSRASREAKVVHSPFDTSITCDRAAMRSQILQELGLDDDAILCGFFGSFVARKRPLLFVDAVSRLAGMCDRPVVGLMFGESKHTDLRQALDTRIERAAPGARIEIMGYRTPGHNWIAGCDMLMVPAINEPLGRTLVEAMLVGTPVVASRSGGNPEAIREGFGWLVPPDDADALAEACLATIQNPQRAAEMARDARLDAIDRFAASNHAAAIRAIYAELLTS